VVADKIVARMHYPENEWHGEHGDWTVLFPDIHPRFADPLGEFAGELRSLGYEVVEITRDSESEPGRVY